jgi:hypothetical protein
MEERPIVNLRNVEDLKKVMFVQRMITRRAKEELLAVASDAELLKDPSQTEYKATEFMAEERKILEKYAKNPTLTEYNLIPNLKGGTHFGATFGVALLVGELILEQVKVMQGQFENVLRRAFLTLLIELDAPKHSYLVEPLEKAMKFTITRPDGSIPPPEEQAAHKRKMVQGLIETFLVVSVEYGIVSVVEDVEERAYSYRLTNLGKRILLHLLDAEKFVALLVEAHTKFQTIRPKLGTGSSIPGLVEAEV